jgi:N-acetylmuramoyl-L-alanine amidase
MTVIKQWFIVFLSDGHGMGTAGKRTPFIAELKRFVRENEFNRAVVKLLKPLLLKAGIIVVEVAPTDEDTPLGARVTLANRIYADYCKKYGKENVHAVYMSVHYNAMDGEFDGEDKDPEGQSVHISPGSSEGRKVAKAILAHLTKGTAQKNRGIVEQNLYETRETHMPAVLSENGFMDNKREALLMLIPEFQEEVASEHAKGLCDYFGIPYETPAPKPAPAPKPTPMADESEHVVKQGETLWGISGKYNTTVSELRKLNTVIAKTDDITPGMVLKVRLRNLLRHQRSQVRMCTSSRKATRCGESLVTIIRPS